MELKMVKAETIRLHEELEKQFFRFARCLWQGFHIHIFNNEPFSWSYQKRLTLARQLKKRLLIDE